MPPQDRFRFFSFDETKATEAAALLLGLESSSMEYVRLLKLLYLADRAALDTLNAPIVGGRYYSMPYGPVLDDVYSRIKTASRTSEGIWPSHIGTRRFQSFVRAMPRYGSLSQAEEAILRETSREHRDTGTWDLVEFTHSLVEWKDPNGSAREIEPEEILRALEKTREEIEEIVRRQVERRYFAEILKLDVPDTSVDPSGEITAQP